MKHLRVPLIKQGQLREEETESLKGSMSLTVVDFVTERMPYFRYEGQCQC